MGSKRNYKHLHLIALGIMILLFLLLFILFRLGYIRLNHPQKMGLTQTGVDVSHYQGTINWKILANNDISFAYIKATEGSSYVDECFDYNWQEANKTRLLVGAYHFFSFDSGGDTQAENFLATVSMEDENLPPVIDLELYGDYRKNPPDAKGVVEQLKILEQRLYEASGKKPMFYTTQKCYQLYIEQNFSDNPLWIRSVYGNPWNQNWAIWQYSDKGRMDGYDGEEKYIDLNVLNTENANCLAWLKQKAE